MKEQIWLIFLLFTSWIPLRAQIIEDFSGSHLNSENNWLGQLSDFVITPDFELQLNARNEGHAAIFLPVTFEEDIQWDIYARLEFDPSASNYLRIILWGDEPSLDLKNGYILHLGKTGSGDTIQLIKITHGHEDILAEASMGEVSNRPEFRLRLFAHPDGIWQLTVDYSGNKIYRPEFELFENFEFEDRDGYFGILCCFTKTRSKNFYFDDIRIGYQLTDVSAPVVTSIEANADSLGFFFNEYLDPNSITKSSFAFGPDILPKRIIYDLSKSKIVVIPTVPFTEQQEYVLSISGICDAYINRLDTIVNFVIPSDPVRGQLFINEVLFNPVDDGYDFIEVLNASQKLISLKHVFLYNNNNGQSQHLESLGQIDAGQYMAITPDKTDLLIRYRFGRPSGIVELSIPDLNNDKGNVQLIFDLSEEVLLDEFDYSEEMHSKSIRNADGVSLERISIKVATMDKANWTSASGLWHFGSPGRENSAGLNMTDRGQNIRLQRHIFSPNGDLIDDSLILNIDLERADYVVRATIYSKDGTLVRNLLWGITVGSSATIKWDGKDENGLLLPKGLYVILVEAYSPSGQTITKKLLAILADYIDK